MNHWKTSANGALSLITTICLTLGSFQVPTALQNPEVNHIWLWVTFGTAVVAGVCRAVIGFLQTDAESTSVPASAPVPTVAASVTSTTTVNTPATLPSPPQPPASH